MNNTSFRLILFLVLLPVFSAGAQVDNISIDYSVDDLSSFHVTFSSYYLTGTGTSVAFSQEDESDYRFEWDFGDGETGSQPIEMHRYASAGIYDVTLTVTDIDDESLTWSASLQVTVAESFEVPNVFTPDGDGYNDSFIIRSNGITPLDITIMDRGGNVVYRHSSPVINWDGRTPGGLRVSPGVYYYVISSSEPLYNKNGFVHIFYGSQVK